MKKLVCLLAFCTVFPYVQAQSHGSSMREIIRKAYRLDSLINQLLNAKDRFRGSSRTSQDLDSFHDAAARFRSSVESQVRSHRYRHSKAFQRDLRDLRRSYFRAKDELEYLRRRRSLENIVDGISSVMYSLLEDYREERDQHDDRGHYHDHDYHNRQEGMFFPASLPGKGESSPKVPIHMLEWQYIPQANKAYLCSYTSFFYNSILVL